jgi:L,D-transpeptidase YcbB
MLNRVFLLFLLVGFLSCNKNIQPVSSNSAPIDTVAKTSANLSIFKKDLFEDSSSFVSQRILIADSLSQQISCKSILIHSRDSIFDLYKINNYQLFWASEHRFEKALGVLKESEHEGLDSEIYNYTLLLNKYSQYKLDEILSNEEALELELLMTKSMYTYVHHLFLGRLDPVAIYPEWNYARPKRSLINDSVLVETFNSKLNEITEMFRPKIFVYTYLREVLINMDSLEARGYVSTPIPYIGRKLVKGDSSHVIVAIKARLHSTTEYDFKTIDNVFDDQLFQSIKIYQSHVGIHPSGDIDKATIAKLNFTPNQIRNTIKANMERCRWFDVDVSKEFILVNIPDYTLSHFKNDKIVYSEIVIVGKKMNQTPVFHSTIASVEFNPYWTVPRSIATKEMLPKLKLDPTYLENHNMVVYENNVLVPTPKSFTSYTENNFPFVIKENPGPNNSLGQVKFLFPNPYSIYMHDTPARYLFDNDFRSYSHGCIRLHNPIKYANYLLSSQGITQTKIDAILKEGENYSIVVEHKIPIMIGYFTCYMRRGDSHLYFFNDIYDSDKKIIDALNAK